MFDVFKNVRTALRCIHRGRFRTNTKDQRDDKHTETQTWSKKSQVENKAHQDNPGVGCGAVVVSPYWAFTLFWLIVTPAKTKETFSWDTLVVSQETEIKKKLWPSPGGVISGRLMDGNTRGLKHFGAVFLETKPAAWIQHARLAGPEGRTCRTDCSALPWKRAAGISQILDHSVLIIHCLGGFSGPEKHSCKQREMKHRRRLKSLT